VNPLDQTCLGNLTLFSELEEIGLTILKRQSGHVFFLLTSLLCQVQHLSSDHFPVTVELLMLEIVSRVLAKFQLATRGPINPIPVVTVVSDLPGETLAPVDHVVHVRDRPVLFFSIFRMVVSPTANLEGGSVQWNGIAWVDFVGLWSPESYLLAVVELRFLSG
jgi:hypothetical protein